MTRTKGGYCGRWWRQHADLGYVTPWHPYRAELEAERTARMLLGWAGPARVETAADRVRRQRADAQDWQGALWLRSSS